MGLIPPLPGPEEDRDEIDRLIANARKLDGLHLPYIERRPDDLGDFDPVVMAEEVTRQAVEAYSVEPTRVVVHPRYRERRLAALSAIDRRIRQDAAPGLLARALRAVQRLYRAVKTPRRKD